MMIYICCAYCEYRKLVDIPVTDYGRLDEDEVTPELLGAYSGVKVHIGKRHKNEINTPLLELASEAV